MAILVTGGAGFIGGHFIRRLLDHTDLPIICLDNFNEHYTPRLKRDTAAKLAANPRVSVIEADFCDADFTTRLLHERNIRQIIHLGGYANVRASVNMPALYQATNVGGTLSLLEAARQHSVERFVFVSSSTVYGKGAIVPFQEDAPLGVPTSPYGATKQAAEVLALTYHRLHQVPVVCLRPFSVYGPRLRPDLVMSVFTSAIDEGRPLPLFGDGGIQRDFTHVSDICAGLLAALDRPEAVGMCINLGHHQPVPIRQLIELISAALGKTAKIEALPVRAEDAPISCADLTRARQLLGYEPKVELADGVREYAEWYLREGKQLLEG